MSTRKLLSNLLLLLAAATALGAAGCKKKGGGGGAWLVGEDGLMAQLQPDGALGDGYALEIDEDLLGIACRGLDTAFVVGEAGTMLRTFDGGESWESIDAGTAATLRDVGAGYDELVVVASDEALLVSRDSGDSWSAVEASRDRAWLSVATTYEGRVALAVAGDGTVWRFDAWTHQLDQVAVVPGAQAIAMSHHGEHAAVVGDAGALVRSRDGGATWAAVPTGVDVDLHAAWVTDAGAVIAVGDAGTVLRADGGVDVATHGEAALRAVHIDAHGEGLAAGDAGALRTTDGGRTWTPVAAALGGAVFGLDEIGDGHL